MSKINKTIAEEINIHKSHWIIINNKRNSIWKQPFMSYEGAKAELDYQVSKLKNKVNNWVIEKRGWIDKTEKEEEHDELNDFDLTQSVLESF